MKSGFAEEPKPEKFSTSAFIRSEQEPASRTEELAFERVKTQLKAQLGSEVYTSWFGRMKLDEVSKSLVRLSVPTAFLKTWINGHYLDTISALWKREDASVLKVEVIVRSATRQGKAAVVEAEAGPRKPSCQPATTSGAMPANRNERGAPVRAVPVDPVVRQSVLGSPLDPRYTFQSFV